MLSLVWSLLGIVSGVFIAIQAPINAQLGRDLGFPIAGAAFSFISGAVLLAAVSVALGLAWRVTPDWSAPSPWQFVAGGALGAFNVTIATLLAPRIGAAALMAFLVAGQLAAGMVLDRIGFLGMAAREISLGRVVGAVLLLVGALLIRFY